MAQNSSIKSSSKKQFSWKNVPLLVFSMFMYELFLSLLKKKKRKFYLKSYFDIWLRNSDLHWLACSQVVRYLSLENTCSKSKKYTLTLGYHCVKVFVFGVILVRIFPHSDWIQRDIPYLSVFSPSAGKYGPE